MNGPLPTPRTIAVATGTRAEFGLLLPVIRAIEARDDLRLQVYAAGAHFLPPARTIEHVRAAVDVTAEVPMQRDGDVGRDADAAALGRGVLGFAEAVATHRPDVVLVLGDRIEAFAAAAAASVAGVRVAHLHGGDRAEGIADEAMRHAITKLAHIHLPATQRSAERIIAMGEDAQRVHIVGSPALDGLAEIPPLDDAAYEALDRPDIVVLLHPIGEDDAVERQRAESVLHAAQCAGRVLALHPNHDPGREGIVRAIASVPDLIHRTHLPREHFIGLLRRAKAIVGNSSAGLIEASAVEVWCVNIGPRQAGRERPPHVLDVDDPEDMAALSAALQRAIHEQPPADAQVIYGDGRAGFRTADLLATFDPGMHPLRKRNTF